MASPILSIIVPSYNTARFFGGYSFYESSDLKDQVEVLFINDGSTDNTAEVAEEFCKKNPDRFFLFSKENGGHGSAINYGVQKARGKYFRVIDGDDSIDPDVLLALIKELGALDVDAIVTDFRHCYSDAQKNEDIVCGKHPRTVFKGEGLNECYLKFHSLIFSTDFWKKAGIKLTEKVFYEDQEFVLFPLAYVKSWVYLPLIAYNYSLGVPGQSISPDSFRKHFPDHTKVAESLIAYCRKVLADPNCQNKEAIINHASTCLGLHLEMIALVSERKGLKQKLRSFFASYADLPEIHQQSKKASTSVKLLSLCNFGFAGLFQETLQKKRGFR